MVYLCFLKNKRHWNNETLMEGILALIERSMEMPPIMSAQQPLSAQPWDPPYIYIYIFFNILFQLHHCIPICFNIFLILFKISHWDETALLINFFLNFEFLKFYFTSINTVRSEDFSWHYTTSLGMA